MKVKRGSGVTQSFLTPMTPWTAAFQAPLPMGFSRQEYWSGVPLPSPPGLLEMPKVLHLEPCSAAVFSHQKLMYRREQSLQLPL